jgi:hypothetical protein
VTSNADTPASAPVSSPDGAQPSPRASALHAQSRLALKGEQNG